MRSFPHLRGGRVAVAALNLPLLLVACGDDSGLDDAEATALVNEVLADLVMPGEPRPLAPTDPPEGELVFGFHCLVEAAGLDVDDAVVAFPPPKASFSEVAPERFEAVDVSLLVFDSHDSATEVLAAYDADGVADCMEAALDEPVTGRAVDPLDVDREIVASGTLIAESDHGDTTSFALVRDRILVDVTVFSADVERARDRATRTLRAVVEGLEAGGG